MEEKSYSNELKNSKEGLYSTKWSYKYLLVGIAIKRKVEVIGIFSCITLALFFISINALESPELSLQQTDQQEIVNEISIGLEQQELIQTL
mgnify:CR=1 FL=1